MPEGPEIRRAAQQVHDAVAGQPLRIEWRHPALIDGAAQAASPRRWAQARIDRMESRSKAMLTRFSTGDVLYSHNQLYGEWVVHRPDEPLLGKAVRLIFETPRARAVLYSATDFAWLRAGEESRHPYLARLGPEVLDDATTPAIVAARLAQFGRRRLAAALLDQGVLAGLGNYLRAEILFVARLDPWRLIGSLQADELSRLARAVVSLTRRSLRSNGVCVPDAIYRAARRAGADYEAARFFVFDREGRPCRLCGQAVQRLDEGGRGIFFCAACQGVRLAERPPTS